MPENVFYLHSLPKKKINRKIIAINRQINNTNAGVIQRGAVIHHQLHVITFVSFNTKNTKNKSIGNVIPLLIIILFSLIIEIFFKLIQLFFFFYHPDSQTALTLNR
jgi:hypothetical protein